MSTSGSNDEQHPMPITPSGTFDHDPHRPRYHFLAPSNWMNDPNGLIHWQGVYHMFYQHYPYEAVHRDMHWGHATSTDLVHWTHLPIALAPTPEGPDAGGCWSGCIVDDDGVPTMIYSANPASSTPHFQLPCLAIGDKDLLTWQKYAGNPVMAGPPPELDLLEFRDHSAWKDGEWWYQVIGSGIRDAGGAALLFRSQDLRTWEYLQPLATGDATRAEPHWTGTVWECPDFFALADQHVLVISAWHDRRTLYTAYMVGSYAEHHLAVEHEGFVDFGTSFYAPQSMYDNAGRRIMFGWLRETRTVAAQRAAGWSGVMSLPRILTLTPEGGLSMQPAPELRQLRGEHTERRNIELRPQSENVLAGTAGTQLEIMLQVERGDADMVGLKVRCSADGIEETMIAYDWAEQRLFVDRTRSSLSTETQRDVQGRPFIIPDDEHLSLHVFLDGSVVEVFANDQACLTERIYPERADSIGVSLFVQGGSAMIRSLDVWEMGSIW